MDRPEAIRILYIEDDPGLARLVQKRLGRVGYTVDIAADGEEGLAKYNGGSYDLVFVDQTLPRYDGLQVIRSLASRGPLPPMIMITGTGDETVAVEAMKLGTSDYIVKDVDGGYLSLLPSVVAKVLQQRRAVEEKQRAEAALKREQEKFQALVEESPLGISITGKDGHFKYINPTFTEIFGYTQQDIPTKQEWFAKAYPDEEYRDHVIATWVKDLKKFKGGACRHRTFTVTCKDGSQKIIYFRPITMENGDQFITYEDITDLVRAEEALRESGDKLEKLHDVARRLAACASEEEVYQVAVEAAKSLLTFSFCSLGMVEGKEIATKVTDPPYPPPSHDQIQTTSIHNGHTGTANGNATLYGLEALGKGVKAQPQSRYLSLLSVPIGDLGVFQVASIESDAFTKNDTRLLELLLGHTAAAIKRIRLQTELKEQAIHDPLTGLYNRYYLNKILDREVKRSKRHHHRMSFMMIDVNRFKEINDRYGHQMGDEILKEVAALMREAVRESDIVVRYGGDEFLIVLTETNGEVDSIKQRITKKVTLLNKKNGGLDFPVTLSIGSASWDPQDHTSVEEIMIEADKRMYEDKKGHNGLATGGSHA
jgi:diguanylate cyclase (GGDEF)-like protein/PAS domain S-box-containing protein